jgi:uncharacterized protein YdiU (UPF0061 family)
MSRGRHPRGRSSWTADFTLTFRRLADAVVSRHPTKAVRTLVVDPTAYDAWTVRWRDRLAQEPQGPDAKRTTMRLLFRPLSPATIGLWR